MPGGLCYSYFGLVHIRLILQIIHEQFTGKTKHPLIEKRRREGEREGERR